MYRERETLNYVDHTLYISLSRFPNIYPARRNGSLLGGLLHSHKLAELSQVVLECLGQILPLKR